MNIMQLLSDTGLNPFAAKLLAESWDKLPVATKSVIPAPLVFTIGNCEITLRDSQDKGSANLQPTTPQGMPPSTAAPVA
jgi:hypothetical protein